VRGERLKVRSQHLPRIRRRTRDALLRGPGMRVQQQAEDGDDWGTGSLIVLELVLVLGFS
jgi:hypothetical protein